MQGCHWSQEENQTVIRPTLSTLGAPLIALVIFSGTVSYMLYFIVFENANVMAPMFLGYGTLNVLTLIASYLWFRWAKRPLILDGENRLLINGSEQISLQEATTVTVREIPSEDSNAFRVELIVPGRERIWIGKSTWREFTEKSAAIDAAEIVAKRLTLPLEFSLN